MSRRRRRPRPAPRLAFDPRVFGESHYDRVTSMLMAVVVGAAIVVGWLVPDLHDEPGIRRRG